MTLEQLLMFKTVAKAGTLKAASDKLFKTQPAISQGIKQLESQLNLALFSREGYRLVLTLEGKKLLQHAQRILDEANELKYVAQHLSSGNEASITVAFEASFNLSRILPILELTQNSFPHTQIIIKQEYITGATDALMNEKADIIISSSALAQMQSPEFELAFLLSGCLIDVASPALIARHPQLQSSSELTNEYQIVVQDTGTGTANIEYGVQSGQRRWYVTDFYTKKMLIESGMGWGKLPQYLMESELNSGTLVHLDFKDRLNKIQLEYYVMRKTHKPLGPVAQALWQNLANFAVKATSA